MMEYLIYPGFLKKAWREPSAIPENPDQLLLETILQCPCWAYNIS
jgi:hypothetical protein